MLVFGLCTTVLLTPLAELKAMPIWRLFKNVEVKLTLAVQNSQSHNLQIESATPLSFSEVTNTSASSVNTSKFSSVITAIKCSVEHMKPDYYGIVTNFKPLSSIS